MDFPEFAIAFDSCVLCGSSCSRRAGTPVNSAEAEKYETIAAGINIILFVEPVSSKVVIGSKDYIGRTVPFALDADIQYVYTIRVRWVSRRMSSINLDICMQRSCTHRTHENLAILFHTACYNIQQMSARRKFRKDAVSNTISPNGLTMSDLWLLGNARLWRSLPNRKVLVNSLADRTLVALRDFRDTPLTNPSLRSVEVPEKERLILQLYDLILQLPVELQTTIIFEALGCPFLSVVVAACESKYYGPRLRLLQDSTEIVRLDTSGVVFLGTIWLEGNMYHTRISPKELQPDDLCVNITAAVDSILLVSDDRGVIDIKFLTATQDCPRNKKSATTLWYKIVKPLRGMPISTVRAMREVLHPSGYTLFLTLSSILYYRMLTSARLVG